MIRRRYAPVFTTMLFLAACASLFSSLSLVTACISEPIEFVEWTIPVPEGTRIIEYAAVPMEERTDRIELVEESEDFLGNPRDVPRAHEGGLAKEEAEFIPGTARVIGML